MDSSVNSLLIAQHIQDRIEAATAARIARAAKLERRRLPQRTGVLRRLGHRAPAETPAPSALAPVAPR